MTYRWLDDLDQALTAGGVPFVPVGPSAADATGSSSWRNRGRPASTGDFNPQGILCHHTASPAGTSDQADLNAILWGNSEAPGPISQLYLGRTGTLYLVAAGRANHGGRGRRPGIDQGPCADMNAALVGIEAGNAGDGREVWPDVQTDRYAATVAALCAWYGWSTRDVWLHATTGPPGGGCNSKIDPAGPWAGEPANTGTWSLDTWRAYIDSYGYEGDDDDMTPDQVALLQSAAADAAEARRMLGVILGWQPGADNETAALVKLYAEGDNPTEARRMLGVILGWNPPAVDSPEPDHVAMLWGQT